jgi:hypothetical protein
MGASKGKCSFTRWGVLNRPTYRLTQSDRARDCQIKRQWTALVGFVGIWVNVASDLFLSEVQALTRDVRVAS